MAKKIFVKLTRLGDLWKDDERWQANVRGSGVQDGYTLGDEEGEGADEAEMDEHELECLGEGAVEMYDFMGSAHEQERFYPRSEVVYKRKSDGTLWVEDREDLYEF